MTDKTLPRPQTAQATYERQIIESITQFAIVVTDRNGLITEWNPGAEDIMGWSAQEMVGRSAETFFTPEDNERGQAYREMADSISVGRAIDERWHLKSDGTRFWASGEMMPLRDDDDAHIGFVKVLRDRTDQHLLGQRLEQAEQQLRQAQEAGGIGLCSVEIGTGLLSSTPQFSRLFGLEHRPRRPADDYGALVVEEDRHLVSTDETRRSGEAPVEVAYRIGRADTGAIRWIHRKGEYQRDEDGRPVRYVGIARDVTDEMEVDRRLAESEARWRGLFEQLKEGFLVAKVVRDGAGRIVDWRYEEVNEAWGALVGIDPAFVRGRTLRDVIPGIEDEWVVEFATVVETGVPIRFTRRVGTLDRWYDGICQPLDDDRFSVLFMEVSERVRAETRRHAISRLNETLLAMDDPDAMAAQAAASIGEALGADRVGYGALGEDGTTFVVPFDWTRGAYPSLAGIYRMDDFGLYAQDLREGRTVVVADTRLDPRTAPNVVPLDRVGVQSLVNQPVTEGGRTVAILYVNMAEPREWTDDEVAFVREASARVRAAIERRRTEQLLRESDERQRMALDVGDVGIFEQRLESGDIICDTRVNAAFGVREGRIATQEEMLAAIHPMDRALFDANLARALAGDPLDIRFRTIGVDDDVVRWVAVQGRTIGAGPARRFIGAVRNVSEEVAEEERRLLMNRELAHRLKNTLAIVQSIATQTLRTAPDLATARNGLSQRIQALSKAHDILVTGQRDAGDIESIIRGAIELHDPEGRITLRGSGLQIGPKAALTLALIMHELATNAAKYGALSVPEGRVHIAWVVDKETQTGRPTLILSWRELHGPPAAPPARKGFGTRLIEMGLSGSAGGEVELDYSPEGLRCRITASLTELQSLDQ